MVSKLTALHFEKTGLEKVFRGDCKIFFEIEKFNDTGNILNKNFVMNEYQQMQVHSL